MERCTHKCSFEPRRTALSIQILLSETVQFRHFRPRNAPAETGLQSQQTACFLPVDGTPNRRNQPLLQVIRYFRQYFRYHFCRLFLGCVAVLHIQNTVHIDLPAGIEHRNKPDRSTAQKEQTVLLSGLHIMPKTNIPRNREARGIFMFVGKARYITSSASNRSSNL